MGRSLNYYIFLLPGCSMHMHWSKRDQARTLYLINTLIMCEMNSLLLWSLPSSIGQSIRLKFCKSEGCEFNPHSRQIFSWIQVRHTLDMGFTTTNWLVRLVIICLCKSSSVTGLTSHDGLESTQILAWCGRSFFVLQSLPSSIGQSIRLKFKFKSEGCEFDPRGGPFSFTNLFVPTN